MRNTFAYLWLAALALTLGAAAPAKAQQGQIITQYRAWCTQQGGRVVTGNDANDLGGLACVGANRPVSGANSGVPTFPGGYNPAVTALGAVMQPFFNQIGQALACSLFGCSDPQAEREAAQAAALAARQEAARQEAERQAAEERERQRVQELNEARAYVESRNRTGLSTAVAPRDLGLGPTLDTGKRDLVKATLMTDAQRAACALGYLEAAARAAQLGKLDEAVAVSEDAKQVASHGANCEIANAPEIGRVIDANESAEVFRKAELLRKLFVLARDTQKAEQDLDAKAKTADLAKEHYEISLKEVETLRARPPQQQTAPAGIATTAPPAPDAELEAALNALQQSQDALDKANGLLAESQKTLNGLKNQFKEANQQLGNTQAAAPPSAPSRSDG